MDDDYNDQMDSWMEIELDGRARAARKAAERVKEHNDKLLRWAILALVVSVVLIIEGIYYFG